MILNIVALALSILALCLNAYNLGEDNGKHR